MKCQCRNKDSSDWESLRLASQIRAHLLEKDLASRDAIEITVGYFSDCSQYKLLKKNLENTLLERFSRVRVNHNWQAVPWGHLAIQGFSRRMLIEVREVVSKERNGFVFKKQLYDVDIAYCNWMAISQRPKCIN